MTGLKENASTLLTDSSPLPEDSWIEKLEKLDKRIEDLSKERDLCVMVIAEMQRSKTSNYGNNNS